jgi:hypothetical protein
MATSTKPADGIQVVIAAAGTVVAAATQPYDNTHTLVIYNATAAVDGYVNWQTGAAAMVATGAIVVPGGGSITLSIGPASERVTTTDTLQFDGSAPCTFQITYVNGRFL